MSLEVWLQLGKPVTIGGKEMLVMPLPLPRLREAIVEFDKRIWEMFKEMREDKVETPNLMQFIVDIINSFDTTELAYKLLTIPKNPETNRPVNDVTKEFLDEYLDIPSMRKLMVTFVEVNEIEGLIKNLQSLPMLKKLMEAATTTYGVKFLNFLQQNTASNLGRSQNSLSPRSTDTSVPDTTGTPESGPEQKRTETEEEKKSYLQ